MGELSFGKERRKVQFNHWGELVLWILQGMVVCLIAVVFTHFFGQQVSTIGDSMNPVLKNGDVALVNRMVYNASVPKRGDIIVFNISGNEDSHAYIKRIVALPGETVEIKEGILYVNGKKEKKKFKTSELKEAGIVGEKMHLANDEFFVLGDNRLSSEDSRSANVGNVKRSEIKGKAWFIISPRGSIGFV